MTSPCFQEGCTFGNTALPTICVLNDKPSRAVRMCGNLHIHGNHGLHTYGLYLVRESKRNGRPTPVGSRINTSRRRVCSRISWHQRSARRLALVQCSVDWRSREFSSTSNYQCTSMCLNDKIGRPRKISVCTLNQMCRRECPIQRGAFSCHRKSHLHYNTLHYYTASTAAP